MNRNLNRILAAGLVLCASLSVALAAPKKAKVKLVNRSDWTIMELYMSPTDDNEWGEDLLEKHVIKPGENFTLTDIPCDSWDVKLVIEGLGDSALRLGITRADADGERLLLFGRQIAHRTFIRLWILLREEPRLRFGAGGDGLLYLRGADRLLRAC